MSVLMFITILVSIQFKVMQATWLHNSAECREVLSDVNREHERQGKRKAIRRRNEDGGGRGRGWLDKDWKQKRVTASAKRGRDKCNTEKKQERRRKQRERGERELGWWLSVEQVGRRH